MTPEEFKQRRQECGMSQQELADAFKLERGARTIREVEAGQKRVTGPMELLLEYIKRYGVIQ